MKNKIKKLDGANMDIDLTTARKNIHWDQNECLWNKAKNTKKHKCAVKNVSICPYFCGIEHPDKVMCSYPNKNSLDKNSVIK